MTKHLKRYIPWYDPMADKNRWKVIDLEQDDSTTSHGKKEVDRCGNSDDAHSVALGMEIKDDPI
jgi:hypothetical protein